MKVLHLIKTTSGANWALKQIEQLVTLGCDIHIVLPNNQGLAQNYRDKGAKVHILNVDFSSLIKKPNLFLSNISLFRSLLKEIKPDIVHSHFVGTTIFMRIAMKGLRIKKIFQVPGPLHLEKKLTRALDLKLANKYDYWIPTCNLSQQIYLASGIKHDRLMTTFYGTDISTYKKKDKGVLREEFEISKDIKVVGMVAYAYAPKKWLGQTRGLKGHEDLIDAMEIVIASHPNVKCVIIGGPWVGADQYFQSIVEYGKNRLGDQILFLGTRTDVPDLYPDIDVVVHPSHSENLGGAAESLLMAVPTIATDIGGFPDIVKPGITGWLVPKENPKALAEAILEALSNPQHASNMAQEGAKQLKQILDVKKTSKDVFDFYKKILVD
ncbi:glycosyltransferase family 4 protein [Acinetobacter sp. YH12058]|uniref:glycosyltransferase family 4 protein n=1 Tax=Acinetobacter sp. YH12058 TaxID=2601058 RepID=UPI0015D46BAB|nr:glycosyltransferase family 4 protein [Acinetobacter sp. YH12058]